MRTTLEGSRAIAATGRLVSVSSASSPIKVPGPATLGVPSLPHVGAVGVLALAEQRDALVDVAVLRADRQNAQRVAAEQRKRRHALQEGDVVLDGHARGDITLARGAGVLPPPLAGEGWGGGTSGKKAMVPPPGGVARPPPPPHGGRGKKTR